MSERGPRRSARRPRVLSPPLALTSALLLACGSANPLDGLTTDALCAPASAPPASLGLSPAPARFALRAGAPLALGGVRKSGTPLAGAWSDFLDEVGATESASAPLTVRFEDAAVLREARTRCGLPAVTDPDAYLLLVRPEAKEVLVAGSPTGQARALATLRQLALAGPLVAATVFDAPKLARRIFLEGFYGEPYTWEARRVMARLSAAHKLNTYYLAPKFDFYSTLFWRMPYSAEFLDGLRAFIPFARDRGLDIYFSLGPGGDISYGSAGDRATFFQKLDALYDAGVRFFVLAFDDVMMTLSDADKLQYPSYAAGQLDFLRAALAYLRQKPERPVLSFVPTTYSNLMMREAPEYTRALKDLDPSIAIGWTGEDIVPVTITAADVDFAVRAFGRPPVLGDNYPVRDSAPDSGALRMLPIDGRETAVFDGLAAYGGNAMVLPRASMVPMASLAELAWNPADYAPARATLAGARSSLGRAAPSAAVEAVRFFADHTEGLRIDAQTSGGALRARLDAWRSNAATGTEPLRAHLGSMAGIETALLGAEAAFLAEISPWTRKMRLWGALGLHLLDARGLYPRGGAPAEAVTTLRAELAAAQTQRADLADAAVTGFATEVITALLADSTP